MNPIASLIACYYFVITLLSIFAAISIPFSQLVWGLFSSWLVFAFFSLGSQANIIRLPQKNSLYESQQKILGLGFLATGSIFASLYVAKFYTGKTLDGVLHGLLSRHSLYNEYQKYFIEQNLAKFSFSKIPAVLSLFYIKMTVLYSFISVLVLHKRIIAKNIIYLFIIGSADLFFSLARGTSFEAFELIILLFFCLKFRAFLLKKRFFLSKSSIFLGLFILGALGIYSYNISARYSFNTIAGCATKEFCLNFNSYLFKISPALAGLTYKLSGYFIFGIFYTSQFIEKFWLTSFSHYTSLLLPFFNSYFPQYTPIFWCGKYIDCGVAWVPDFMVYILRMGWVVLLMFFTLLGVLARYLLRAAMLKQDFLDVAALYFIFLALISLPVGTFITISSANKLAILFLLGAYCYRKCANSLIFLRPKLTMGVG